MYFRYFVIISPLEKGGDLYLNKLTSLTCECFVPSLVGYGEEDEIVKSLQQRRQRQRRRTTDKFWSENSSQMS